MWQRSPTPWIACALIAATVVLPLAVAQAQVPRDTEVTDEIVVRCIYHMGEFGIESVRACTAADLAAVRALSQYPAAANEIVTRCVRQTQHQGWGMVKTCADRDIEAATALAGYAETHRALIEQCRAQVGRQGPAKVRACADQAIAADEARTKH
jgi:hypothetical protein